MTDQDFQSRYGPWAVVAGASTGLGAAFADEAAQRGLNVMLLARRRDVMEQTAQRIRDAHGVEVRPVVLDMAAADAAAQFVDAVSGIDVGLFIYNAALEPQGLFIDESTDELLGNITVNCVTPTLLTHHVASMMARRGRGGVVLVSSMGALQGIKVFAAYGAAKSYELILAEGLWDELRDHGVDACAYVVGSTAAPTFLERQKSMKTTDEQTLKSVFGDVGDGVSAPRPPQQVAAALFPQLGTGPRLFSDPADEQAAAFMATLPRRDTVEMMGKISSMFWE